MPDVVVVGSINVDLVVSTARHPRPGETVTGTEIQHLPGGKGANQAVAAARAGATVRMIGAVGDDDVGADALRSLRSATVETSAVKTAESTTTGVAFVVVAANGENTIVVVPGANDTVRDEDILGAGVQEGDVLVTQYEIPVQTAVTALQHGRRAGATCILNPAPATTTPPEVLKLIDVLVVNQSELALLSRRDFRPDAGDAELIDMVGELQANGLSGLAVATLGARGVLAVAPDGIVRIPGQDVKAVDTTGAGDCFVGALAAQLGRETPIDEALDFANAAAALCVTRDGAGPSLPTVAQIERFRDGSS